MTLQAKKIWNTPKIVFDNSIDLIKQILNQRDINSEEEITKFLNPHISDLYDSSHLYDSQTAAKKIIDAAKEGKTIYIHGDFDTDGVCATAILWQYIYYELSKSLGVKINVKPYIPDRVDEGYGLSTSSCDAMRKDGAQLVITVDCGIRDGELIRNQTNEDFEIIVTDHHQPPENIEEYEHTIVHQMYPRHEYPYMKICGSVVSLLLTQAIRKELGEPYEFNEETKGLDLAAIATVTDLMPLLDVNRAIVKFGISQIQRNPRPGLSAILSLASVDISTLDSYHFGFVIGPRLNAAGRIGHAMDALRLLLAPSDKSAYEYSSKLHNLNLLRQENTQNILELAQEQLPSQKDESLIFIHGTGWHEGIIGLVASKIFEKTAKPTVILTTNHGETKGSARSPYNFNITQALQNASEYLIKYGGHAQAAGFSVKEGCEKELQAKLQEIAKKELNGNIQPTIEVDLEVSPKDITAELFETFEKLKPYGFGNLKPILMMNNLEVNKVIPMSNGKHIKLEVSKDGYNTSLLLFNSDEDVSILQNVKMISIVGSLISSAWNGKTSIEVQVKEWKSV